MEAGGKECSGQREESRRKVKAGECMKGSRSRVVKFEVRQGNKEEMVVKRRKQ